MDAKYNNVILQKSNDATALNNQIIRLTSKVRQTQDDLDKSNSKVVQLQAEVTRLQTEVPDNEELAMLRAEVIRLRTEVADNARQNEKYEKDKETLGNEIKRIQGLLTEQLKKKC